MRWLLKRSLVFEVAANGAWSAITCKRFSIERLLDLEVAAQDGCEWSIVCDHMQAFLDREFAGS
eukprot:scaffold292424_cov14-Tisochrysis_lutea.AAC.1